MDLATNVETITQLTRERYNIELNNTTQAVEDEFIIFPKYYFCPKSYHTGKIYISKETHTIHHFNGSWQDQSARRERNRRIRYRRAFGEKIGNKVLQFIAMYKRKDGSLKNAIKRKFQK